MDDRSPLVSVIMAVKDTEPYLKECLESIINQSYPHWELIAVNDHSTDNSATILGNYADKDSRIKVFEGTGERLIPTLKQAYHESTGVLINRMDSDDIMPENKLSILVGEWTKYGRNHVVAGGTKHFVSQGEVGDGFLRYERWLNDVAAKGLHYQEIYRECVIPSHSWIMHREDFDRIGSFDLCVYPEDYDVCFRMYSNKLNIVGIPDILHFWRDRSNRISRTWKEYEDNRYFDLKLRYFYKLDRDIKRPLVLWGAGRNGKDLARMILANEKQFEWICDNEKKIGHVIYGIQLKSDQNLPEISNPQIIIAVSSPDEKRAIQNQLEVYGKEPIRDYWFFL